jgi:phosphate starvation-inducible PhoH-like protein
MILRNVLFCAFLFNSIVLGKVKMPAASMSTVSSRGSSIAPIGDRQKEYCKLLYAPDVSIISGLGPAGCGKTFFACRAAVGALASGSVERLVITRPLVSADEELGFLPGSLQDKMDPWVRPMMDILGEFYTGGEIRRLITDGIIEISPLAYMRGRTFKNAFIIADEMQNSTPNQMLMMLTRIGEGSRLVITGDLMQSDLPMGTTNGLADFHRRWSRKPDHTMIRCVEFEVADVQRSAVVASVLEMYSDNSSKKSKKSGMEDAAIIPWGL